ncbi:peptide chain release factor N(5)-glutamine methyltransferase [Synechococcales cyanobacterium C]|uniref:Release factor glutamine methyltransferase n=1 Tax=Petrachloros mirabilis ULC683 TaxID=2781853 RepID=A0A8K2A7X8_9CYAN|nr:peptide chain release factor N(5)-glutamine methyltransferase [Petrachloros mirabilis ULC683]
MQARTQLTTLSDQAFATTLSSELEWLLQSVADLDRLSLRLANFKTEAQIQTQVSLAELEHLWQRRQQERMPIQYLVGITPWRDFELRVRPGVLIPRPETELLVDLAVEATQGQQNLDPAHWVDLGTGSGAIALGLARVLPQATLHAVDRSQLALTVARQNATVLGLESRIRFYQGSWLEPLTLLRGHIQGIVSNPPYIPAAMVTNLQPEVAWHEPRLALAAGADGLSAIREIVAQASGYLVPGGVLLMEMMAGQSEAVVELLRSQAHYTQIQIHADLAGIPRFAQAHRIHPDPSTQPTP